MSPWTTEREQLLKRIEQLESAINAIRRTAGKQFLKSGFRLRCIERRCQSVTSDTSSDATEANNLGAPVGYPKTCKDCDKSKAKANKPKATLNKSKKVTSAESKGDK